MSIILLAFFSPVLAGAADFNKNFIISDEELFDVSSMNLDAIQHFLEQRDSGLSNYLTVDVDGIFRTAAEIIWRAAITFNISPKFLLVLLQKEQSLVEAKIVNQYQLDWATGFARCDTCPADHPDIQDKKGFALQIYHAAKRISEKYLRDLETRGKTIAGFGPGITKTVDRRIKVTPANKATAILYTYTPHIKGNKNLWKIWNRWFSPLYPDGTLLQEKGNGGIWLIEGGLRRAFLSKAAFSSRYDIKRVIVVDKNDLERYPKGRPIKFKNYSMLKLRDGSLYLVAGNKKRAVASKEVMRSLGYTEDELIKATADDLLLLDEGETITPKMAYPLGALLQDPKTSGVFFALDDKKHPIIDRQLLDLYFKGRAVNKATAAQLAKLEKIEPFRFKDGELVGIKQTGEIYFISNGERRKINKDVLFILGFDEKQIVWTKEKLLKLHPVGAAVVYTTAQTSQIAISPQNEVIAANDTPSTSSTEDKPIAVQASNLP